MTRVGALRDRLRAADAGGRAHTRWLALFVLARAAGTAIAVVLLAVQQVTDNDGWLILGVVAYTGALTAVLWRWPELARQPVVWVLDAAVVLGLVYVAGDWRSPFYMMALTALALPVAILPFRAGILFGIAFTAAYGLVALAAGPDPLALAGQASVETLATHLLLPLATTFAIAYAGDVLRRLDEERRRSEVLAIEAERRRIAFELHDSAKQRVHAAHLVVSALRGRVAPEVAPVLEQALAELESATADMETSLAELRSPLEGRPLHVALAQRAAELGAVGDTRIRVVGRAPQLPPLAAAHAFRIATEAMTNAVRHAGAHRIQVRIAAWNGTLRVTVADDGRGMPEAERPGTTGMMAMRSRALTIGATLDVGPGLENRGTAVRLEVPLDSLRVPQEGGA